MPKSNMDQQVSTGGSWRLCCPHQALIQKEVQRLIVEQLRGFQGIDTTDNALRKNVDNMSMSSFTEEIKWTGPPRKFSPPYFTLFKGDEDPDRHLIHYRSIMILYCSNDVLMCKIFATTLQDEAQDCFHTLPPYLIQNFSELSLVFTKEYSFYRSINKKSDYFFNMKKDPNESLHTYVKRFKVENVKIVGYDDNIACSPFRKRLPADHPFFRELIMVENLSLANS
ncbi:uncharacterized protein [Pyrus communis]|uniref:uncharacterized protein n=1 Tax=Pyrus communis TaxID=23211 RepID=UPI0035BF911E